MQRRSTTIFLIGLLTLVLGAATTFAALHGNKRAAADTGKSAKGQLAAPVRGQPTSFTIPAGKQALAVALDSVSGSAGTASAGSHIDVFAAVTEKVGDKDKAVDVHAARLIIQDVQVLAVNGVGYVPTTKDASVGAAGTTTYILAVSPEQAEKLVFHASFSKLWFSVLPAGAKPVPPTPGVTADNQLDPVAAV
jgi:Flp pilus assembly protein CpaB